MCCFSSLTNLPLCVCHGVMCEHLHEFVTNVIIGKKTARQNIFLIELISKKTLVTVELISNNFLCKQFS